MRDRAQTRVKKEGLVMTEEMLRFFLEFMSVLFTKFRL
jgi:hypothetical protein